MKQVFKSSFRKTAAKATLRVRQGVREREQTSMSKWREEEEQLYKVFYALMCSDKSLNPKGPKYLNSRM